MIYVQVKIRFKDGTKETFDSADTPMMGNDWTTLFPLNDPLSRRMIRTDTIEEVSFKYANKKR
jgi:hypothetical protein